MHGCRSPVPNAARSIFLAESLVLRAPEKSNHASVELGTTSLLALYF